MSFIVNFSLNYKNEFYYFINIFFSTVTIKLTVTMPYVYMAKFLVVIYRHFDQIETKPFNENLANIV